MTMMVKHITKPAAAQSVDPSSRTVGSSSGQGSPAVTWNSVTNAVSNTCPPWIVSEPPPEEKTSESLRRRRGPPCRQQPSAVAEACPAARRQRNDPRGGKGRTVSWVGTLAASGTTRRIMKGPEGTGQGNRNSREMRARRGGRGVGGGVTRERGGRGEEGGELRTWKLRGAVSPKMETAMTAAEGK